MMFAHRPNVIQLPASGMISTFSREGMALDSTVTQTITSQTYAATQRAYYYPLRIGSPLTIRKFFWLNGATASTNNIQIGLYYDSGANKPGAAAKLGTSTLAANANVCQYDDIADTMIGAGLYWIAIWGSGTTTTIQRMPGTATSPSLAYLESSLASGLPATATPASQPTGVYYMIGMVVRSTP